MLININTIYNFLIDFTYNEFLQEDNAVSHRVHVVNIIKNVAQFKCIMQDYHTWSL